MSDIKRHPFPFGHDTVPLDRWKATMSEHDRHPLMTVIGWLEVDGVRVDVVPAEEYERLRGAVAAIFDDPPLHGPGQCDECDERWRALRKAANE